MGSHTHKGTNCEGDLSEERWCGKCFLAFPTVDDRIEHVRKSILHHASQHCNYFVDFDNQSELSAHQRVAHFTSQETPRNNQNDSQVACIYCPDVPIFNDLADLKSHYLQVHATCRMCGEVNVFQDQGWMDLHYQIQHPKCKECAHSQPFEDWDQLHAHERREHGFLGCPICLIKPRIPWSMSERFHMDHCHFPNPCNDFCRANDINAQYCYLCREAFETPRLQKKHCEEKHYCTMCADYASEYHDRIDAHIKYCRGETPHEYDPFQRARGGYKPRREEGIWAWPRDSDEQPFSRERAQQKAEDDTRGHSTSHGDSGCEEDPFREQQERQRTKNERGGGSRRQHKAASPQTETPADIYEILGVTRQSSLDEIKRITREKRIATHPDKLKREGLSKVENDMIDEVAKMVGWAADIMLDPDKRRQYDMEVDAWRMQHG